MLKLKTKYFLMMSKRLVMLRFKISKFWKIQAILSIKKCFKLIIIYWIKSSLNKKNHNHFKLFNNLNQIQFWRNLINKISFFNLLKIFKALHIFYLRQKGCHVLKNVYKATTLMILRGKENKLGLNMIHNQMKIRL
jgi:hypothetical protein